MIVPLYLGTENSIREGVLFRARAVGQTRCLYRGAASGQHVGQQLARPTRRSHHSSTQRVSRSTTVAFETER